MRKIRDTFRLRLEAGLSYRQLSASTNTSSGKSALPDWAMIYQELERKGMANLLLWEEVHPTVSEPLRHYSKLCDRHRRWLGQLKALHASVSQSR